jgi:hypothetical protein
MCRSGPQETVGFPHGLSISMLVYGRVCIYIYLYNILCVGIHLYKCVLKKCVCMYIYMNVCIYIYSESNKVTYASIYADLWIDNVCLRKGTYTYIYIHF